MTESPRIHRLLNVHSEDEQVDQQLGVTLRLHSAAHQAKAHVWRIRASVGSGVCTWLGHEARDECMEWPLARRNRVRQPWIERESCTAIVEREAGTGHDDT